MQNVKCIAVGDKGVGKNSMFWTYVRKEFPKEEPTIQSYSLFVTRGSVVYTLGLFDIAAELDDRVRHLQYAGADVVLICFDTNSPGSLESAKSKWVPEVQKHCQGTPFLLVGTKTDIRDDTIIHGEKFESHDTTGTADMAKVLGAQAYFECSAMRNRGIEEVINGAVDAAITGKTSTERKDKCIIM